MICLICSDIFLFYRSMFLNMLFTVLLNVLIEIWEKVDKKLSNSCMKASLANLYAFWIAWLLGSVICRTPSWPLDWFYEKENLVSITSDSWKDFGHFKLSRQCKLSLGDFSNRPYLWQYLCNRRSDRYFQSDIIWFYIKIAYKNKLSVLDANLDFFQYSLSD